MNWHRLLRQGSSTHWQFQAEGLILGRASVVSTVTGCLPRAHVRQAQCTSRKYLSKRTASGWRLKATQQIALKVDRTESMCTSRQHVSLLDTVLRVYWGGGVCSLLKEMLNRCQWNCYTYFSWRDFSHPNKQSSKFWLFPFSSTEQQWRSTQSIAPWSHFMPLHSSLN